jgi:hypothetical protein
MFTATGTRLRNGTSKSCGCLKLDTLRVKATTHGLTAFGEAPPRLYRIWTGMKTRCSNPKTNTWQYYGGRGIKVCPEWQDFEPFRDWAFANGYRDDLTIDRKDNDRGYEPDNCRWATYRTQRVNQRPKSHA